jgi:hypothetical protein
MGFISFNDLGHNNLQARALPLWLQALFLCVLRGIRWPTGWVIITRRKRVVTGWEMTEVGKHGVEVV